MTDEKRDQEAGDTVAGTGDAGAESAQDNAAAGAGQGTDNGDFSGFLSDDELISTEGADGAARGPGIAELEAENEQLKDAALRAQAEAQNIKRRADQDVEKARKFALERFGAELLPVVDNLERSLEAAQADDPSLQSICEGVELTLKSFQDALHKFHIEAIDPAGEPFDPSLHQAMSMVENPDCEPNTVLAVMQKGYTLNGRLLRPAMVMVSKAPSS